MNKHDILFRFVIQRASNAEVIINQKSQGLLPCGLVIFMGIAAKDNIDTPLTFDEKTSLDITEVLKKCADKILGLRIFTDANDKMNLSVKDVKGGIYVISQFTLFADCASGFRPGFSRAAKPDFAKPVYEYFVNCLKQSEVPIYTGIFSADMQVKLTNLGPVTILLEADLNGIKK